MKTTKTIFLLIVFSIMVFFRVQGQNPGFEWAVQMGGDSIIQPKQIAVDLNGNQIITGIFRGTADFNPSPDVTDNLVSNGLYDIFIQKLDPDGNLLWAASMGDVHNDAAFDVETDGTGNIYMTGYFWGTIDADPGPEYFELSQIKYAAFVLKIDPSGNLIWAKQMGFPGDAGLAYGYAITVDNSMNVITTGYYYGRVDFDPGNGTFNLTSSGQGGSNIYIQKLDASGNFVWAKQLEGTEYNYGYAVTTDESGNIYSSGFFKGTVDFNPDPNKKIKYNLTSKGDYDAFVLKLTGNGDFVWAKQIGGYEQDLSYSLAIDPYGYLYTTGQFYGTADFNPGTGTYNMASFGGADAYILKLDPSGNFVWAKQIGGSLYDSGGDIILDGDDNFYVSGVFYSTTNFSVGGVSYYLTANGNDDSFVAKYNNSGELQWAIQTGGAGWDYSMSMALDASGNIFNVGNFQQTVDFNPDGNGYFTMTNADASGGEDESKSDMFIQKLNPSGGDYCPVPSGLTATNITETTADLSWSAVAGVSGYYIRYREINTDWIEVAGIIGSTNLPISGLVSATAYEFQVKTDCFSNYSYSGEFLTTGAGCVDIYEPNATMATAAAIPVNKDIAALIGLNADNDWFKFSTTNAAKNIKITLTNLPADYNIKLYKADGTLIGTSANTGTTSETIIYNYNRAGTYYVLVNGYNGAYDLISCYTLNAAVSSTAYRSVDAGINTSELTEGITVYPNPSNSTFSFTLETESDELVIIQIFDMSGRLVQEYNSLPPDDVITLGEDLKPGMYMAIVTQGNYRKMVKLSKIW